MSPSLEAMFQDREHIRARGLDGRSSVFALPSLPDLTDWSWSRIEALRRVLKNEPVLSPQELFVTERSLPHGHAQAVLETVRRLELDKLIAPKRSHARDLVLAMIVERLIHPCSKLATTWLWHTTTLAEELGVSEATEDDLYEAMDWLLERQSRIERQLADRHLAHGTQVLYDVTSSYYEGHTIPRAARSPCGYIQATRASPPYFIRASGTSD
jgi:hypothetical protein